MPIMDNKNTFLILSMKHEEMAIRADRGLKAVWWKLLDTLVEN